VPEFRKDPITGSWVIIATERARRPDDFVRTSVEIRGVKVCPFCRGNEDKTPPEVLAYRNGSHPNSPDWNLRVVPNKFPALRVEGLLDREGDGIYDRMSGVGAHEVIIETPDHFLTLADLPESRIEEVFWSFRDRIHDLKRDSRLRYILIFKNHGEAAGASIEHTHSQLIALPVIPRRVEEELEGALRHWQFKERCVFCDVVRQELRDGSRIVAETDHFAVLAPYAPRFPFETWIVPKEHRSHFESAEGAYPSLAWVLRSVLRKIDKVLEKPAYNLMLHTAPAPDAAMPHYHWHIEIIPKLARVAGFEWGTGFHINPTPPEESAQFLRDASVL
jgi:UDPglucose--hexose-1-phosphate uridylyltransferase